MKLADANAHRPRAARATKRNSGNPSKTDRYRNDAIVGSYLKRSQMVQQMTKDATGTPEPHTQGARAPPGWPRAIRLSHAGTALAPGRIGRHRDPSVGPRCRHGGNGFRPTCAR